MDEEIKKRLATCIALWNSAEKAVKESELISRKLNEPAVNELRYAGRWLILAFDSMLKGKDRIDALTSVVDALGYAALCCAQAKHDAIDSMVLFLHEKIDLISEKYTEKVLSIFIKGYLDFLVEVEKVDSFIVTSREERHNRTEIYDEILKNHVPHIREFLLSVRTAEAAMNDELQQEKQKMESEAAESRKNLRLFWWSFGVNVFLALVSIGLGIVAIKLSN